jgi:hypothetical protein
MKLIVAPSMIVGAGLGLFTSSFIKKRDRIVYLGGVYRSRAHWNAAPSKYGVHITKDEVLDCEDVKLSGVGRYANNTNNNNARIVVNPRNKRASLVAVRNIHQCSEIYTVYGCGYYRGNTDVVRCTDSKER